MSELNACPFCGAEAAQRDFTEPFVNGWVGCPHCHCFINWIKAGKPEAVAAWNRRYQEPNEPLTLEQLREMDGEPVWIDGKDYGGWTIFKAGANKQVARCLDNVNLSYYMADYSKTWIAYRRKPESEEV